MDFSRKVEAIERMGSGHLSKIYLEWNKPWWESSEEATIYLGGYFSATYFLVHKYCKKL